MNHKPMKEENIYIQISRYLQLQYPEVPFHFDFGSGIKMTIGQAVKNKRMNPLRGYPDLFIAVARNGFHGLFIEIKKDVKIPKTNHVKEQLAVLNKLNGNGYKAIMAGGFEAVKKTINDYLNLKQK